MTKRKIYTKEFKQEAERIRDLENQLALLTVEHQALRKSHERLVLKMLGDSPKTADFLNDIQADIVENFPESAK